MGKVITTLGGRLAAMALSFGFAIVVARSLDPVQRGDFAILQALSGLAVIAVNIGIGRSMVFHVGKRLIEPARATAAGLVFAFAGGVLALVVASPFVLGLRGSVFDGIELFFLFIALVLTVFLLMREFMGASLVALGRPMGQAISHAIQPLVGLLAMGVVVISSHPSLGTVVLAWSAGVVCSGIVAASLAFSAAGARPGFRAADARLIARFGLWVYPVLVTQFLNLRLDQFLVRVLASPAALGYYAVAVGVGELLIQIPTVLLWALSGAVSSAEKEESAQLVSWGSKIALAVLIACAIPVALLAPIAVPWVFGLEYRPAVGAVLALLPGMVFYAPAALIADYFVVQQGKPTKAILVSGSSLLVGALLNIPLAPAFGAVGAGAAASLAYLMMLTMGLIIFCRDTGMAYRDVLLVRIADLRGFAQAIRTSWLGSGRGEERGA